MNVAHMGAIILKEALSTLFLMEVLKIMFMITYPEAPIMKDPAF